MPCRQRQLFTRICGFSNLVCAYRSARRARRYRYCLRADIVRFFPSVDHQALMRTVRRVVACRRTLALLQVILDGGAYVRYADDFRLFADTQQELHAHHRAMQRFLAGLRLVLHDRKTRVQPCAAGVPFLGFVLYPSGRRRLQRGCVRRFRRRLRRLAEELETGLVSPSNVSNSVRSWLAHAAHADTRRLSRQILGEVSFPCRPRSS